MKIYVVSAIGLSSENFPSELFSISLCSYDNNSLKMIKLSDAFLAVHNVNICLAKNESNNRFV